MSCWSWELFVELVLILHSYREEAKRPALDQQTVHQYLPMTCGEIQFTWAASCSAIKTHFEASGGDGGFSSALCTLLCICWILKDAGIVD